MRFSREFLDNRFFQQQMLTVDAWSQNIPMGPSVDDIGVRYEENGDVRLCLFAPQAKEVKVILATSPSMMRPVIMAKESNGTFRGVLPFDPSFTGPVNAMVLYDGNPALDPYLPICWTMNRPFNIVEIPDPDGDFLLIKGVPHGAVSSHLFWSKATENWERCMVYTPAGYMNNNEHYPVLYLLNGGTDNETSWDNVGRISNILDNLIAEGKVTPFIAVMTNSMLRDKGKIDVTRDHAFEQMLIDSCIPFVEQTYRVKTGKENRGIAGLSMGAYMTCDIAFGNPDLFDYVGTFTASMQQTPEQEAEQYEANGYIRPYLTFLKNVTPEQFEQTFKVYFRSTTPQEDHPELFAADDRLMCEAGYDSLPNYKRILYPETTSKWNSWRMGLRDFVQMIFK